ncbi:MAG: hypothetical protein M0Q92_02595 [Methanoregula sp.]|jgi:hypothetical protein|nr:hypothetical protein [Methanoregula sp.]
MPPFKEPDEKTWVVLLEYENRCCPHRTYPGTTVCCNHPESVGRGEDECKEGNCPAHIRDVLE